MHDVATAAARSPLYVTRRCERWSRDRHDEATDAIAFEPTGEVIVASGAKGGKDATARLRKVVSEYSEQVNADLKQREADEERAVEQKIADLSSGADETLQHERAGLQEQAQGLKDELRARRDQLEAIKPMLTLGEIGCESHA